MKSTACTCLAVLCLFAGIAAAQEVLTNESIIKLHDAGLPGEVILAKIRSSQTNFDTSVDALVALSGAGLPKEVIAEMAGATSAPSSSAQSIVVRQGASAAPNVAAKFGGTRCSSPGIFVEKGGALVELESTTYTAGKSRGRFLSAVTYGVKSVKSKAVIQGTTSPNRAPSGSPVFYFCFEETETGLSYTSTGATNPSEFLLVELTVNHKGRYREFVTGVELHTTVNFEAGRPYFLRAAALDSTFTMPLLWAIMGLAPAADSIAEALNRRRDQLAPLDRHFLDYLTATDWVAKLTAI
ncbi:MAG: hypothetical protein IH936_16500, partial [Acidobacteria bacterium]|nr:hypothetical protein [Acidobacteriota bacterium]